MGCSAYPMYCLVDFEPQEFSAPSVFLGTPLLAA
jgi:hypothetical protein